MDTLRSELIETQKVRSDLMKWKLLILAGIGGAALGFSGSTGPNNSHLALAIIPVACVYVDLLCRHLSLRNKIIGKFIEKHQTNGSLLGDYERFYARNSVDVWKLGSFESVALVGCTVFVSIAIIPVGILAAGGVTSWILYAWPASLFYGAGAAGISLSIWIYILYDKRKKKIDEEN